jgi:hypothetical protein
VTHERWRNPFLADSEYSIAHGFCDQRDSTHLSGPIPISEVDDELLEGDDYKYEWLGPGHFGGLISGLYPDGKRTIWSNGREKIVKLDYETLQILASFDLSHERPNELFSNRAQWEEGVAGLDNFNDVDQLVEHAVGLASRFMTGLDGVYSLLDIDHVMYLGRKEGVVAYAESDPSNRHSPLLEKARWNKPNEVEGFFVGINITPDGRLVLSTDHGWLVSLSRDFSDYVAIQIPEAVDQAAGHCERMEAERGNTGYGWVRTSLCCDEEGGVYLNSVDHLYRIVWNGEEFSFADEDGAWSAEYRNETGVGSGTTPSLMGDDPDKDRFVVIGDGDQVVNITLFWRDAIPSDWERLSNAPSHRIAGLGAANMGDSSRNAIQTEQSITVAGYGAMTVNNEPDSLPTWLPGHAGRLLTFFLGHHPSFTPYGLHKYEWDSETSEFREAWVNKEVSSPNSVPYVSIGNNVVYTCGTRDGRWTIEALDWSTGESLGYWATGDSRFNTLGSGVQLDNEGRIVFGSIFGKSRILRLPTEEHLN